MPRPADLRARAQQLRDRFPERPRSEPPPENGKRLACIGRGPDEELRVHWSEFQGKPFLSVRLWARDRDGGWWPDGKRGVAIRVRELSDLAEAVAEALDLAEEHLAGRARQPARDGAVGHRVDGSGVPPGRSQGGARGRPGGFDEFGGGA